MERRGFLAKILGLPLAAAASAVAAVQREATGGHPPNEELSYGPSGDGPIYSFSVVMDDPEVKILPDGRVRYSTRSRPRKPEVSFVGAELVHSDEEGFTLFWEN